MNIIEMAPYILGKKYTRELKKEPIRCSKELIEEFKEATKVSETAARNIKGAEKAEDFFNCEPGLIANTKLSKAELEECFYAVKMGRFSPIIPSKYLFLLDKVNTQLGSFNLLAIGLGQAVLNNLFAKGTIADGYCLYDIIRTLYQKDFKPVGIGQKVVKINGYYEVLLDKENRILFLPKELRELLSDDDIDNLSVRNGDVYVYDRKLKFISKKYFGAYNKVYDMRGLV